jgi:hypothetical protein
MARPALEALAEQQKVIQAQAGRITQLTRTANSQHATIVRQAGQIQQLASGLQAVAEHLGTEALSKVASAMLPKRADVQNPAQPVPEPPSEPAPHGTQETKTPEAFADVNAPGLVPGSTQDVAADVVSTVYTPGQDVPAPAVKQLVDVTRPVDGTQSPQPLGDVKTLTDVRVGDPMNPQTAFPLRGDFAGAQRTSAHHGETDSGNARTMAALRLAKLRIEAGTAESTDEFVETARIEKDASLTTDAIERDIATLTSVKTAAQRRVAARNPGLVPRTAAAGQRSVPSMQGAPMTVAASAGGIDQATEDSALFD